MVPFMTSLLLHSANLGRQEKVRPLFHILLKKRTPLQREHHHLTKIKQVISFKTLCLCVLGKLNFFRDSSYFRAPTLVDYVLYLAQ